MKEDLINSVECTAALLRCLQVFESFAARRGIAGRAGAAGPARRIVSGNAATLASLARLALDWTGPYPPQPTLAGAQLAQLFGHA